MWVPGMEHSASLGSKHCNLLSRLAGPVWWFTEVCKSSLLYKIHQFFSTAGQLIGNMQILVLGTSSSMTLQGSKLMSLLFVFLLVSAVLFLTLGDVNFLTLPLISTKFFQLSLFFPLVRTIPRFSAFKKLMSRQCRHVARHVLS